MSNLVKAFDSMNRRGLFAYCQCYCDLCSQTQFAEALQQYFGKGVDVRGIVHLGTNNAPAHQKDFRIPILFGSLVDGKLVYDDPNDFSIGESIARCLQQEGIRYEWNKVPGSPIFVKVTNQLTGVPANDQHSKITLPDGNLVFRAPQYPDEALDSIKGNPLKLVNLATLRRLKVDAPCLQGSRMLPRVGDKVKLGFFVQGSVAPLARQECGDLVDRIHVESMRVEVMDVVGEAPRCIYHGELLDVPIFIDPAKLRIGSPVNFTPEHVYPVKKRNKKRRKSTCLQYKAHGQHID